MRRLLHGRASVQLLDQPEIIGLRRSWGRLVQGGFLSARDIPELGKPPASSADDRGVIGTVRAIVSGRTIAGELADARRRLSELRGRGRARDDQTVRAAVRTEALRIAGKRPSEADQIVADELNAEEGLDESVGWTAARVSQAHHRVRRDLRDD